MIVEHAQSFRPPMQLMAVGDDGVLGKGLIAKAIVGVLTYWGVRNFWPADRAPSKKTAALAGLAAFLLT